MDVDGIVYELKIRDEFFEKLNEYNIPVCSWRYQPAHLKHEDGGYCIGKSNTLLLVSYGANDIIYDNFIKMIHHNQIPGRFWKLILDTQPLEFWLIVDHHEVIAEFSKLNGIKVDEWFLFGSIVEEMTLHQRLIKRKNGVLKDSDIDVVIITDSVPSGSKFSFYAYDIQTMTVDEFNKHSNYSHVLVAEVLYRRKQLMRDQDMDVISIYSNVHHTYWFSDKLKLDEPIDTSIVRHTFSEKSSHSFVKAKKKLIDGDMKAAYKSYFHSIRLMHLAIAICRNYGSYMNLSLSQDSIVNDMNCDRKHIFKKLNNSMDQNSISLPEWAIERYKDTKRIFKERCPK